ncbi:binder of sperm protein homolog 1 [Loxodonta africana]|uniref:binder of sperm protein homolog 1 n=1 Tax=Loxodonta africana TaxID=9785 RepID=UPI0030CC5B2B
MALGLRLLLVWICLLHSVVSYDYEEISFVLFQWTLPQTDEELSFFVFVFLDGKCAFPFNYKDRTFYSCIKSLSKHDWCSLNKTYQGYWKYCGKEDVADCAFPFWYKRMIYRECTDDGSLFGKKWCSLTQNYNKDGIWRYCD